MNTASDETLMIQLAAGQDSALQELLTRYWPVAYRFARTLTLGDPSAAEDVAQESFLQIYLKASTYSSAHPFRPWFFKILQNSARERQRGELRREKREQKAAKPEMIREEKTMEVKDDWSLVKAQLEKLPAELREALQLRFIEGFPLKTIAELSACPEGTVSSRIRRGTEMLRQRLLPRMALSAVALTAILESHAYASVPPCPNYQSLVTLAESRASMTSASSQSGALIGALLLGAAILFGVSRFVPDERPTPLKEVATSQGKTRTPRSTGTSRGFGEGSQAGLSKIAGESDRGRTRALSDLSKGTLERASKTVSKEPFALRGELFMRGRPMKGVTAVLRRDGSNLIEPATDRFTAPVAEDGQFLFEDLKGEAKYWTLEFKHDDYEQRLYFRLDSGSSYSLSTDLKSETLRSLFVRPELMPVEVSGLVLDDAREPIANAQVTLWGQSARTDRDGRYLLVAARSIQLFQDTVVATAAKRNTAAYVLFAKREEKFKKTQWKNVNFQLNQGRVLRGRVVDEWKRPLENVEVHGSELIANQSGPFLGGIDITRVGWGYSAKTNAHGEFLLQGLNFKTELTLELFSDKLGFSVKRQIGPRFPETVLEIVIKAERHAWRSHIVGPEGRGVEGAHVVWLPGKAWLDKRFQVTIKDEGFVVLRDFEGAFRQFPGHGGQSQTSDGLMTATTNSRGAFSLDLPQGKGWLCVSAPGYSTTLTKLGRNPPEQIVLEAEEVLKGTVRNEFGKGVPKILVHAYPKGTIDRFSEGTQVLRGMTGLRYGPKTPMMLVSGHERCPKPIGTAMTDKEGRYALRGLRAGEYDVVLNPAWSFFDRKSELALACKKNASTAIDWDFELKTMNIVTATFQVIDARLRSFIEGCKVTLWAKDGIVTHFPDSSEKLNVERIQFPSYEDLYLDLTKSGYSKMQVPLNVNNLKQIDLGPVYLVPEVGQLRVNVKNPWLNGAKQIENPKVTWDKIELFIHEKTTGCWSWKEHRLTEKIERIEIPDLSPGVTVIEPYVRAGEWPNETFKKLNSIYAEIEKDRLSVKKLVIPDLHDSFKKRR